MLWTTKRVAWMKAVNPYTYFVSSVGFECIDNRATAQQKHFI